MSVLEERLLYASKAELLEHISFQRDLIDRLHRRVLDLEVALDEEYRIGANIRREMVTSTHSSPASVRLAPHQDATTKVSTALEPEMEGDGRRLFYPSSADRRAPISVQAEEVRSESGRISGVLPPRRSATQAHPQSGDVDDGDSPPPRQLIREGSSPRAENGHGSRIDQLRVHSVGAHDAELEDARGGRHIAVRSSSRIPAEVAAELHYLREELQRRSRRDARSQSSPPVVVGEGTNRHLQCRPRWVSTSAARIVYDDEVFLREKSIHNRGESINRSASTPRAAAAAAAAVPNKWCRSSSPLTAAVPAKATHSVRTPPGAIRTPRADASPRSAVNLSRWSDEVDVAATRPSVPGVAAVPRRSEDELGPAVAPPGALLKNFCRAVSEEK